MALVLKEICLAADLRHNSNVLSPCKSVSEQFSYWLSNGEQNLLAVVVFITELAVFYVPYLFFFVTEVTL